MKKNNSRSKLSLIDFLKGDSGFSLAEVMVAAGMLGVLSLGVTQLMQNSSKTEKRLGQQINLANLESEILQNLNNQISCNRSFSAIEAPQAPATTPPPYAVNLDLTSWNNLPNGKIFGAQNPDEPTEANWPIILEPYDNTDPTNIKGVYGNGSNTVSVRSIGYKGFVDRAYRPNVNISAAWGNNDNFGGNAERDPIVGTAPAQFYGRLVIRVEFTRGNYGQFAGLPSDTERKARSSKITQGSFVVNKFYFVNVRVNAANQIISCYNDQNQIVENYCEAFGGDFNVNTGQCNNLILRDNPAATASDPDPILAGTPTNYALTTANEAGSSGSILAQGGIQIGRPNPLPAGAEPLPPTNGDLRIYGAVRTGLNIGNTGTQITTPADPDNAGDVAIGRDLQVYRSFGVGTDAQLVGSSSNAGDVTAGRTLNVGAPGTRANNLGDAAIAGNLLTEGTSTTVGGHFANSFSHVGAPATPSTAQGDLTVENTTRSRNFHINSDTPTDVATIGLPALDTSNKLRVNNGPAQFTYTSGSDTSDVRINANPSGAQIQFNQTATNAMRVSHAGNLNLTVLRTGEIRIATNGTNRIILGQGTSASYRPIIINGQDPANTAATGAVGTEAATKAWVRNMIYGDTSAYSEADIANIVANITQYAQHKTELVIQRNMCENTFTQQFGNGATIVRCDWITGSNRCVCNVNIPESNCSDDSLTNGTRVCNDIYVSNRLDALGTITSASTITGARVHSNDWMRAQRIYTQVSGVAAPSAGWIRAQTLHSTQDTIADRDVLATRHLIAGRSGSESRVCSRSGGARYCYTKLGKFTCRSGANMIGIAHGHPICARAGANEAPIGVDRWIED